jgi:hypothetical protein
MKLYLHFYINSHLPYDILLSCHMIGMTTQTLVVPMRRFLLIFPFWDVSTVKKRTWSNQDIQARPLVLTTVASRRVWVIKFHMYKYYVIWHLQVFFLSEQDNYRFFQWIDGPELVDQQILLFPYDRNESSPLQSFKRWVHPLPNPPPMTDEEKNEVSTRRVCSPPACKCGYHAELANPPPGLDYTSFFCCLIPLSVILDNMLYILLWLKYLVYINDIDMCCVL